MPTTPPTHRPLLAALALACALAAPPASGQAAVDEAPAPEPDAALAAFLAEHPHGSAEMARLAPLVGDWKIVTRAKQQNGSYVDGTARWRFWYVLDGKVLMDEWRAPKPDGSGEGVGVNLRHHDPSAGHYVALWLDDSLDDWRPYTARFEGDRFVMRGKSVAPSGAEGDARITFYGIEPDSFRWKLDWSVDGGETWIPEVFLIEATRSR